jgi:hypothetical protein
MTHKPVATRGDGLHLVPSQTTERYQAEDVPAVWPKRGVDILLRIFVWGFVCGCGLIGGLWWMSGGVP